MLIFASMTTRAPSPLQLHYTEGRSLRSLLHLLTNRSPECSLPPAATVAPLLHPCHRPVAALLVSAHLQRLLKDHLNSHWIKGLTS